MLMRILFFLLLSVCLQPAVAQNVIIPGDQSLEQSFIKLQRYEMDWYMLRDTSKIPFGSVLTEIKKSDKELLLITQVKMNRANAPWIDSSIASLPGLAPVYHSSFNMQRDMVLRFGKIVTGYYYDKLKKTMTELSDTTTGKYFDSNLYPYLLSLVPMKERYTAEFPIFDHNPAGKKGIIRAYIRNVSAGEYLTKRSGVRKVWKVMVQDELGSDQQGSSTYYFDQQDRRLWKQEIQAGGRMMLMLARED